MRRRKNIIKVAIDSPAAAGAGTQAKLISKHLKSLKNFLLLSNKNNLNQLLNIDGIGETQIKSIFDLA